MKKSKLTKSNDPIKILRMISRDLELERNDGKFVSIDKSFKNKKKYNRTDKKRELRKDLNSLFNYIHVSFFEALGQLLELGIIVLFIYKLVETATYY